jgi:hypothetical protein
VNDNADPSPFLATGSQLAALSDGCDVEALDRGSAFRLGDLKAHVRSPGKCVDPAGSGQPG